MATLHELITKVIPLKGILRIPSYWMRKVLMAIADAVEAVRTQLNSKVKAVDSKVEAVDSKVGAVDSKVGAVDSKVGAVDSKVEAVRTQLNSTNNKLALEGESLGMAILYAKTGQPFFILGEGTKMIIDGNTVQAEPYKVYKAKSLKFSEDTSKVDFFLISLNIPAISFSGCTALTSLDLFSFDTSAVTSMASMFKNCTALTSLDLSNFNTSAVTSMYYMFKSCRGLTSLNLFSFDT